MNYCIGKTLARVVLAGGICAAAAVSAGAATADGEDRAETGGRQYTYAWMFTPDGEMRPRGGTTKGPEVTFAPAPGPGWKALREPSLTKLERDRRAILAMAGGYRTTFDFIETVGFTEDYQPRRPYQSWATEHVRVIADEPRFISLQHILVMRFVDEDGSVSGPHVMKHWRQDWRYEDRDLHVYTGNRTWEHEQLPEDRVAGTWSQTVYQVDDSPRYESVGTWEHYGSHSTWTSGDTWRPLPRREFSVRDDYDVLTGVNRVTITPRGWVHEQDNLKLALDGESKPASAGTYLARETGLNRYERIEYDFSAGEAYWEETAPFWGIVRGAWGEIYKRERFTLKKQVDDESLVESMFGMAARFDADGEFNREAARRAVDETLQRYLN